LIEKDSEYNESTNFAARKAFHNLKEGFQAMRFLWCALSSAENINLQLIDVLLVNLSFSSICLFSLIPLNFK
jgi:hypothetical protein